MTHSWGSAISACCCSTPLQLLHLSPFQFLSWSNRFSESLAPTLPRARKACPCATTKTFISSIHEKMVSLLELCPVSVDWKGCQCEVKGGCLGGESNLFAHVQAQRMDGDTDGRFLWQTFLWLSLSVFGETWKPCLEWTGIVLREGETLGFNLLSVNSTREGVWLYGLGVEGWGHRGDEVSVMWLALTLLKCLSTGSWPVNTYYLILNMINSLRSEEHTSELQSR